MDIVKPRPVAFWKRRTTLWIACAIAAVIGGASMLGAAAPEVARADLWIDTVRQGEMKREIRANGTLVPRQIRWIAAGTTASVQEVVVEPGAKVSADTVILRLFAPELQANHEKAQAALSGAEADVAAARSSLASQLLDHQAAQAQAEADWRIAEVKLRANERAHAAGIVSAIDLKQGQIMESQSRRRAEIEAERVSAFRQNMHAMLRVALSRRDEAASALAVYRQQVDSLQVRAGIDGILQQVEVEPGQQIEAGAKLARVVRPDDLIARLQVSEIQAKDLALGLPVSVDTRNGLAQGKIFRIDPAVRNGSVTVDVAFDKPLPAGARPDLSIDGRILLGTLPNVLSIGRPASAGSDGAAALFVLSPSGDSARRVQVRFGAMSSDRIEVREGLKAGDQVVLSDASRWKDFDTIDLN